jgi:hypothetical protein
MRRVMADKDIIIGRVINVTGMIGVSAETILIIHFRDRLVTVAG